MLSYKQWQAINESVMPTVALGVKGPQSLGVLSKFALYDEAKKKSKKKMHDEDMDMDDEDVTGDGEMVDASSDKDEPADIDIEGGDDEGGGCKFCGKGSKKKSKKKAEKKSKKKMWSDEDDDGGEEDDDGGEEDADLEAEEEETGEDLDDDGEEGESEEHVAKMKAAKGKAHTALAMGGGDDEEAPLFSKKKSKKKSEKKSEKKMQKESVDEDEDWMASVKSMLGATVDVKFDDGWSAYHDPLDPLPGEVGYAPQGKIGG